MKKFNTFQDANTYSQELSKKINKPVLIKRGNGGFVVEDPLLDSKDGSGKQSKEINPEYNKSITYENIPEGCNIIKKNERKAFLETPYGDKVTVWKIGVPRVKDPTYGHDTRQWERHELGVTRHEDYD